MLKIWVESLGKQGSKIDIWFSFLNFFKVEVGTRLKENLKCP